MKTRIKLVFGVAFAAAAVMAASQSVDPETRSGIKIESENAPCYSNTEVQILMKSNHWSEQEAKTILDLACKFSSRTK